MRFFLRRLIAAANSTQPSQTCEKKNARKKKKRTFLNDLLGGPELIKPPTIKARPAETSEIATNDARAGDKSKYSIKPLGGNGNLFNPWIKKAIATPNLKNKEAKASKFEKKLFILFIKFFTILKQLFN